MSTFVILGLWHAVVTLPTSGNKTNDSSIGQIKDVSGDYPQPAISRGYEGTLKMFPHAARLYAFRRREISSCTAEIIHNRLLMTAAHCVMRKSFLIVVTGKENQKDYVAGKNLEEYVRYKVSHAFVHPMYTETLGEHDVAVIKLARPMIHEGYKTIPVCYDRVEGSVKAIIYGWGGTDINPRNTKLYAKNISVEMCSKPENPDYEYLCLLQPGPNKGDSGGPIIIDGQLRGICSHSQPMINFTISQQTEQFYYIALSEEKEFLEKVIRENGGNYNRSFLFLILISFIFII